MGPYGPNTLKSAALDALTSRFPIHRLLVGTCGVDGPPMISGVPDRDVCEETDNLGPRLDSLDRVLGT